MLAYTAFNQPVFAAVPTEALSILDVGCGTGAMGNALIAANADRQITGITYSQQEAGMALKSYTHVYVHDLNDLSLQLNDEFDCIIFSHVLEHTVQPLATLKHFLQWLKPGGQVIVALPNVLFFKQRWQFLRGRFTYNPNGGLMDSTHLQFFDFTTAQQLVKDAGLQLISARGYGAFPQPLLRKWMPSISSKIDAAATRLSPGLFSFQFVLVAHASN